MDVSLIRTAWPFPVLAKWELSHKGALTEFTLRETLSACTQGILQEFNFLLCCFVVKFIPFGDDGTLGNTGNDDRPSGYLLCVCHPESVLKAEIQQLQI